MEKIVVVRFFFLSGIVLRLMLFTYTRAMTRFSNCCGLSQLILDIVYMESNPVTLASLNIMKNMYGGQDDSKNIK